MLQHLIFHNADICFTYVLNSIVTVWLFAEGRKFNFQVGIELSIQLSCFIIGIKHGFPCINVCQVPREMLKTEAVGRGFQHLPRDLANVNVLENNV